MRNVKLLKFVMIAMLCAVAFVVAAAPFLRWKPLPGAQFLTYEPKDVIILVGGVIFGPIAAIVMSVVVAFIEFITVSTEGIVGLVMNIISSVTFVLPVVFIYRKFKNIFGGIFGCILGTILMTAAMVLFNIIFTPIFMGVPRETVMGMLVPAIIPFNLIKSGVNSAVFLIISTPIFIALKKTNKLEHFI